MHGVMSVVLLSVTHVHKWTEQHPQSCLLHRHHTQMVYIIAAMSALQCSLHESLGHIQLISSMPGYQFHELQNGAALLLC